MKTKDAVQATMSELPAGTPDAVSKMPTPMRQTFVNAHNAHLAAHPDATQADAIAAGCAACGLDANGDPLHKTDSLAMSEIMVVDFAGTRRTADGYLVAMPRVARTGIQIYSGAEVGRPDMKEVRVYRPEAEVFHKDSLRSYAHRPVTDDHPDEPVNAGNWKEFAVGITGDDVARDGEYVRVPTVLMDAATIGAWANGKKQLSLGYTCDLKWETGEIGGAKYDAVQSNIRANHLAVVAAARGGSELNIGDDDPPRVKGAITMTETVKLKPITVDGIECQVTDTSAAIITRHLDNVAKQIATLTDEAAKSKAAAEKAAADATTAISTKDAEIATLKKQVDDGKVTPEQLDVMAETRALAIGKGRAVLGDALVFKGKTITDIQRQVVDAKLGDTAKGWNADQVAASFNTLTADIKLDGGSTVYDAARAFAHPHNNADKREAAYAAYEKHLTNAWQKKPAA
jgi:hypothetical protein